MLQPDDHAPVIHGHWQKWGNKMWESMEVLMLASMAEEQDFHCLLPLAIMWLVRAGSLTQGELFVSTALIHLLEDPIFAEHVCSSVEWHAVRSFSGTTPKEKSTWHPTADAVVVFIRFIGIPASRDSRVVIGPLPVSLTARICSYYPQLTIIITCSRVSYILVNMSFDVGFSSWSLAVWVKLC